MFIYFDYFFYYFKDFRIIREMDIICFFIVNKLILIKSMLFFILLIEGWNVELILLIVFTSLFKIMDKMEYFIEIGFIF